MELKLQINYADLLALIRQLPITQFLQLKAELLSNSLLTAYPIEKKAFLNLLLSGPVMSEEQYDQFLENRQWINQWRSS